MSFEDLPQLIVQSTNNLLLETSLTWVQVFSMTSSLLGFASRFTLLNQEFPKQWDDDDSDYREAHGGVELAIGILKFLLIIPTGIAYYYINQNCASADLFNVPWMFSWKNFAILTLLIMSIVGFLRLCMNCCCCKKHDIDDYPGSIFIVLFGLIDHIITLTAVGIGIYVLNHPDFNGEGGKKYFACYSKEQVTWFQIMIWTPVIYIITVILMYVATYDLFGCEWRNQGNDGVGYGLKWLLTNFYGTKVLSVMLYMIIISYVLIAIILPQKN